MEGCRSGVDLRDTPGRRIRGCEGLRDGEEERNERAKPGMPLVSLKALM